MPDKDLRLFILHHVITPFLDQKAEEGIRLSAQIGYKSDSQILNGPSLDRKGKSTDVHVTVVCRHNPAGLPPHSLSVEIVPAEDSNPDCASYFIQGVLRKDDRGWYLTESQVRASK